MSLHSGKHLTGWKHKVPEKGEGFPEAKGLSSPKKVSVQAVKKPAVVGA